MMSQKIIANTKGIDEVDGSEQIIKDMKTPSLPECKERFKKFGECKHYHLKYIRSYATTTKIETCLVCAKTFGKKYFTQAEAIADEILDQIDAGVTDKKQIYTNVVDILNVPRPTVRRVATKLRLELVEKVKILTSYDGVDRE